MADAQNRLFSIHGAADALGKDRRTLDRATAGLQPDGHEGKSPRWRLSTIVRALEARSGSTGSEDVEEVIEELERLDQELRCGFEQLEAEPDFDRRRAMMKEIGPTIGALDRALERANATRSSAKKPLLEQHHNYMIGQIIGNFMTFGRWEIPTGKAVKA